MKQHVASKKRSITPKNNSCREKAKFVKQKIQVSDKTRRFAYQENRFNTSEYLGRGGGGYLSTVRGTGTCRL